MVVDKISFKQLNTIKMIPKRRLGICSAKGIGHRKEIETSEGLKEAEVQQAVVGTFLYSQPVGRTARFAILRRMVIPMTNGTGRMRWRNG